jgi:hypothetical protein
MSSPSSSSYCNKTKQKEGNGNYRPLLQCNAMQKRKGDGNVTFFFFLFQQNKEKKVTATSRRLFRGATTKNNVERR